MKKLNEAMYRLKMIVSKDKKKSAVFGVVTVVVIALLATGGYVLVNQTHSVNHTAIAKNDKKEHSSKKDEKGKGSKKDTQKGDKKNPSKKEDGDKSSTSTSKPDSSKTPNSGSNTAKPSSDSGSKGSGTTNSNKPSGNTSDSNKPQIPPMTQQQADNQAQVQQPNANSQPSPAPAPQPAPTPAPVQKPQLTIAIYEANEWNSGGYDKLFTTYDEAYAWWNEQVTTPGNPHYQGGGTIGTLTLPDYDGAIYGVAF